MMTAPELSRGFHQSRVYMDTIVTIELSQPDSDALGRINNAYRWFEAVENACSRFDPGSELRRLLRHVGEPVAVSELLFKAVEFALLVAGQSDGAFDPTVGARMEQHGFTTDHRTGQMTATGVAAEASFADIVLDAEQRTVTLLRPLVLDLGAVTKGFAIDLAAAELGDCPGFAINAGGDVLVRGLNADSESWQVGIRHPRDPEALLCLLHATDVAICTSGDYERVSDQGHHIIDPATGFSAADVASLTVIGPAAMTADALSTAAFIMGPERGMAFLKAQGVEALIVDSSLHVQTSSGLRAYL
jgi:thiamine biosynthesis lipoprotein